MVRGGFAHYQIHPLLRRITSPFPMALRYGQNLQVQNEQYETHTNKTKIGHKKAKQQKMNRTTQK